MYTIAVADAGGLLCAAGILAGLRHEVAHYAALDASTLLVAEYLSILHDGLPARATADYAGLDRLVAEWFPARALAMDAVFRGPDGEAVETWCALTLAEALRVPLVTKNDDVRSKIVPVLHC